MQTRFKLNNVLTFGLGNIRQRLRKRLGAGEADNKFPCPNGSASRGRNLNGCLKDLKIIIGSKKWTKYVNKDTGALSSIKYHGDESAIGARGDILAQTDKHKHTAGERKTEKLGKKQNG